MIKTFGEEFGLKFDYSSLKPNINGEFIGGCDIVTSMYQDGELVKLLKELKLIDPSQI